MSQKRILMVCQLPPPVHGASTVNQIIIESEKIRSQFCIDVLPIQMGNTISSIRRINFSKFIISAQLIYNVFKKLKKTKIDAVYISASVYGPALLRDLLVSQLCKLFNKKVIFHIHMQGMKERYERSFIYRIIYRIFCHKVEVIHVSNRLYHDLDCVVPPERFHVIPNGIPDPCRGRAPILKKREPISPPVVLFLSSLLRAKGPLDLLEASQRLRDKGTPHHLIFVGAQGESDVLAALRAAAGRYPDEIEIHGPLFGKEKCDMLARADIFVLPSWSECQPLVLIEAMASGLPIVATETGAIPEMIDSHNGFLFEPHNVSSLANWLGILINDRDLREEMGKNGTEKYRSTYDIRCFEYNFINTAKEIIFI